ncbi:MAG: cation:proton antiporter [Candidatus Edwardsbacteria bacterium]|nr:cation:proton antiporter [Candidatus Edwardsbacteria bacterium]
MDTALIVLLSGVFIFLAHLFASLFTRTRVPDVLLLIVLGNVVGPVLGIVKPAHFGMVGVFLTTITLVIMLFEGGLDLELKIINQTWWTPGHRKYPNRIFDTGPAFGFSPFLFAENA